ncbi:MAG TPA: response regulator [Gemmatimonadales bacterium]
MDQPYLAQGHLGLLPAAWWSAEGDKTAPAPAYITVLVVDDDEQGRWVTARMLREDGYNVIEAHSGHEALHRLRLLRDVRVLIADIAMPWMSGFQLGEIVARDYPHVAVVLMSGYASLFPKFATTEQRFPLLTKPFTAEQLTWQVRAVLEGRPH